MDYWKECISEALDDCDIKATDEQIKNIAEWVEGAHENYGMATGESVADSNFISDDKRKLEQIQAVIKKREEWENSTEPCAHCNTTGLVSDGWGRDVRCDWCSGIGRVRG
jgi:hypothetical protein